MLQLSKYIFLVLFICVFFQLNATHIVGGELTYTCLGDDLYEIQLTIFRDCVNGEAPFDNPASVGVFSATNYSLIDEILIPIDPMVEDTLDPFLFGECFVVPPDVCVHTTTYIQTVTLPFVEGGYILSYQRCCRNVTISNLVEPLATGATYSVHITETALENCNSSPKFNVWPPLYICAYEPLFFDQSATDQDGDSIVYTLCTPQTGANQDAPMPQPPNPPPYQPVTWINGFSENDMLNGLNGAGEPLMINSETGLLTGLPQFVGQYVVGICVEEYRDGELIGTTLRDFQYNVGECGQPVSAFFAPEVQCDNLEVDFENQSQNADNFLWYFDYILNPEWSSEESNPSFTYPDFGSYEVMFIVNPESDCEDTTYQTINLIPNSLVPNFEVSLEDCVDDVTIVVTDLSTDETSFITAWDWTFSMPGNTQTSIEQDPEFVATEDGNAMISLTITSETGCENTIIQFVEIDLILEQLIDDSLTICLGEGNFLHPNFTEGYIYEWSPPEGLDNVNAPNPFANPTETTTYNVLITNPLNGCVAEREITIMLPELLTVSLPEDYTTCDTDIEIFAESNTGELFFWATDPDFDNIISNEQTTTFTPLGETTYYLLVRDEFGCTTTDEITIIGNGINVEHEDINLICEGESVTLDVQNTDPNDVVTYNWTPTENITSGENTANPSIFLEEEGTYAFYLEMTNQHECSRIDTVIVAALDTLDQTDFVTYVQCTGYSIQFFNASINAPYYIWDFGDLATENDISFEENPTYEYPEPGIYTVTLSFPPSIVCAAPITIDVMVGEPALSVDFNAEITSCSDTIVLSFTDLSENNQSTIIDYHWEFSNGEMANGEEVDLTVFESQVIEASLIITSEDGCIDTLTQEYPIVLLNPILPDTVLICNNESAELNPNGDENLQYLWSPDDFLTANNIANPLANPTETTTYSVTITDNSAVVPCEIVREVVVFVTPPVSIQISGETESCGEELELSSTSINGNGIEWSNTSDFTTIFSEENTVSVLSERDDIFYARSFDDFGCPVIDSIITHNYLPQIDLNPSIIFCINDTIIIPVENQIPSDELTYVWSPESEIIDFTEEGFPVVSISQTASYQVTASNQFGCSTDASTTVVFTTNSLALNITAADTTLYLGESTQLFATPYSNAIYSWLPTETLSSTTVSNPIATPIETTSYQVEIINSDGCSSFAQITIVITDVNCEEPYVFIPNTFSPDGDGVNETFTVLSPFLEEVYLVVYDRWGEKLFETNTVGEAWDGTIDGLPLSPDVYAYYCRVVCLGGESFELKGNVTILK